MKIAIGSDHRGNEVRTQLTEMLLRLGHEVQAYGPGECGHPNGNGACDYPDVAYPVAKAVSSGAVERGILICGSGIGMCIAANKVKGIRAAAVHDEIGAEMSRRHNDANILCLPADMLGLRIIDRLVQTWLRTDFEGGRHARRIQKITAIEQGHDPATVEGDSVLSTD